MHCNKHHEKIQKTTENMGENICHIYARQKVDNILNIQRILKIRDKEYHKINRKIRKRQRQTTDQKVIKWSLNLRKKFKTTDNYRKEH